MLARKEQKRLYRHKRVKKKVIGTSERPRLCVHRSLKNLTAQVVDDSKQKIILGLSTISKECRSSIKSGGNIEGAKQLGQLLAKKAVDQGIKKVCFDRGGYIFHGRVKAFADAAREGGLEF